MPHQPGSRLTPHDISEALAAFSISVDGDQVSKIQEYVRLLLRWNQALSLTTVVDPVGVLRRHFGESMYAARICPVENCRLVDIGTGAGFPGLPLKIFEPTIRLTLIESNKKKCAFLAEVIRSLELSDVEIRAERFENIRPEAGANFITSRAVGDFKRLLSWSSEILVPRGHVTLWVGAEDSIRLTNIHGWLWQPAVHLPDSQRRFILVGRPVNESKAVG